MLLAGVVLGSCLATVLVTIGIVVAPLTTALIVGGLTVAAVLIRWPRLSIYGAMLLGFTALPTAIPTSFQVGGLQVDAYEPLLAVAAIYCAFAHRRPEYASRRAWAFAAVFLFGLILGAGSGTPPKQALVDPRALLDMLLAYYVAASIIRTDLAPRCLRLLRGILWWSAGLTLLSSATGLPLGGRTEDASLFIDGANQASGSLRILTDATHVSLAVLCACIALLVTQRATLRQVWTFLVPAVPIVFISYSRNSVVGIAAVLIVALLLFASSWWGAFTTLFKLGAAAGVLALALQALPGARASITAYGSRVIEGLTSNALSNDASVQYRVTENYWLTKAFDTAPWFGHGFGYAYKPPVGPFGSFTQHAGQWYAHDFYFWLLVKIGIIGMLVFLYWAITPLTVMRTDGSPTAVALGMVAVALLAVSFIAPMPLSVGGNIALGGALGALAGMHATARAKQPEPLSVTA